MEHATFDRCLGPTVAPAAVEGWPVADELRLPAPAVRQSGPDQQRPRQTWGEPITISGDGANGDLGYPSSVELTDGTLLTAWYEQLSGNSRAVLRLAKWALL